MPALIWLVSFAAAALSGPKRLWEVRRTFFRLDEPAVQDAYRRVRDPGRTYHDLKNVLVEWVRADPQTAGKVLCACAVAAFLAGLGIGALP